jgi:hypothetical protein
MNQHEQIGLGNAASQVLDNPAYVAAMKMLRDEVTEQWKACPIRDSEGQLLLLQLAKMTDKFEGILSGLVESGKFAHHKLVEDKFRNESKVRGLLRKVF